jgi:uncharacterized protein (DUF305 family)
MRKTLATTATCTLAFLLAACSGSGAEENASGNMAANEAAHDMNMMADADNPFQQSDMTMSERMISAVGTDVGDTWVRKMIEHHQGAIDMSKIMLQHSPPADVGKMAQETITKQEKEIADLRKLVKEGSPNPQSAEPYMAAEKQMHDAMMAAKGADIAQTFMRKMLEHHKGGVTLSDAALNNGASGDVRAHALKTKTGQQKEADMVEAMLRGEPMDKAQVSSAPANARPSADAKPSTTATPNRVTAEKTPPPPPARAPRADTARAPAKNTPPAPAKATCSAEHAAMGHCTQ